AYWPRSAVLRGAQCRAPAGWGKPTAVASTLSHQTAATLTARPAGPASGSTAHWAPVRHSAPTPQVPYWRQEKGRRAAETQSILWNVAFASSPLLKLKRSGSRHSGPHFFQLFAST